MTRHPPRSTLFPYPTLSRPPMTSQNPAEDRRGSAVVTVDSDTDVRITRTFGAPADAVFRAFTTPELVRRWWADETAQWDVCDIDRKSTRLNSSHLVISYAVF